MSEKENRGLIARFLHNCRASLALLAMAPLPSPEHASAPYLARIGPPPLRFAAPLPAPKIFVVSTSIAPSPTNVVAAADAESAVRPQPEPASVPSASTGSVEPAPAATVPAPNPPPPAHPANDLLIVTPDMLVGYFKPNAAITNGANAGVVAPVNFTPPASGIVPSSQAIYRSE